MQSENYTSNSSQGRDDQLGLVVNILGISSYYHDSSACLISHGRLVAAVSEERFTRVKNDRRFPIESVKFCLRAGGNLNLSQIDAVGYYESPEKKLDRQMSMGLQSDIHKPERDIRTALGYQGRILFFDHHLSHGASAYYFSGFKDAAIFTADGVGEWATTTFAKGVGNCINIFEEIHFPHSLGLLYSAITHFLGFSVLSDEYKVMGLSPYGKNSYYEKLSKVLNNFTDGKFELNSKYFNFSSSQKMYTEELLELLQLQPRTAESEILQCHKDLAKSLQVLIEEIILQKTRYLYDKVPSENLCLAGGLALNCVSNGNIIRNGPFKHVFVQPAAGDAGTCLGAAALAYFGINRDAPLMDRLPHVFLGPKYDRNSVMRILKKTNIPFVDISNSDDDFFKAVVEELIQQKVVGWFQGAMEFGPRALGARSILADPRNPDMREHLNQLVKKREGFRPFAPAVLEDDLKQHFDVTESSPFMTSTCQVTSKIQMPSVTHVDGSARVQSVNARENSNFYRLISEFKRATGCPVLINTSFNVRGEPIVCSPQDAIRCMLNSEIDVLAIDGFLIKKDSITTSQRLLLKQLSRDKIPFFEGHNSALEVQDWFQPETPKGVYSFV